MAVGILQEQAILFLRIILACICGGAIGIERQQQIKVAGTKAHIVIALSSALMMIVSKYGFLDVMGTQGITWDVSRVAAGIITGVGILGSSIIFIGRQGHVSGIITAVGVWVTIGVGMTLGAGMYVIGISTTLLMLFIQWIFRKNLWIVRQPARAQICFRLPRDELAYEKLTEKLDQYKMTLHQLKWDRKSSGDAVIKCQIVIPACYGIDDIMKIFSAMKEVESFELI